MSLWKRVKGIIPGKPDTGGIMLQKGFFMTVLAARMPLPAPLVVATPKGEDGTVAGFIAPLAKEATKDDLSRPLIHGSYAVASPNQKTVIRLVVASREEAHFDPAPLLKPSFGRFSDEERARIAATWTLVQMSFESFDPEVPHALMFLLQLCQRLGELTDGMIADPMAQAYVLPENVLTATEPTIEAMVPDLVRIHEKQDGDMITLATAGNVKISQPELVMQQVPTLFAPVARGILYAVSQSMWKGETFDVGDAITAVRAPLVFVPTANRTELAESTLEIVSDSQRSLAELLAQIPSQ